MAYDCITASILKTRFSPQVKFILFEKLPYPPPVHFLILGSLKRNDHSGLFKTFCPLVVLIQ